MCNSGQTWYENVHFLGSSDEIVNYQVASYYGSTQNFSEISFPVCFISYHVLKRDNVFYHTWFLFFYH